MRSSILALISLLCAAGCSGGGTSTPDPQPPGGGDQAVTPPDGDQPPPDQSPPPPEPVKPEPACLRDKGGCDAMEDPEQLAVNACEGAPKAMTMAELAKKAKKLKGKKVTVIGPLNTSSRSCTAMACDQECCNTCASTLILGSGEPDGKTAFHLREGASSESGATDGFTCKGDESVVCCKYPVTGQEVIVTGTLTSITGVTPTDKRLNVLTEATICAQSAP